MTTKLGELRTYYQRNWEAVFSNLPAWGTVGHVAGLALPFVGLLYKPAGKAISLGSTVLNVIVSGVEIREAKKKSTPSFRTISLERESLEAKKLTKVHTWSLIKNSAEFIGTIASLRIGLAVHSFMDLDEHSYTLFTKFKESTWSQTGERMLPISSNALYLLTLVSFSTPVAYGVIGASLVFQAGWSLYKARNAYKEAKTWKDIKILDAAAHTAMSVIFAVKAKTAIQQCRKILNAVQKIFVLMLPASEPSKETGGLSDQGKTLARRLPVALDLIMKDNGKTSLVFFTSPATHHLETAELVVETVRLGNPRQAISKVTVINELQEMTKPEIPMKDQVEVAARVDGAIRQILDQQPEGSDLLPVFVTGETTMRRYPNMRRYLGREILANPDANFIVDGGMRVVTMTPDEMGDLHMTEVYEVSLLTPAESSTGDLR